MRSVTELELELSLLWGEKSLNGIVNEVSQVIERALVGSVDVQPKNQDGRELKEFERTRPALLSGNLLLQTVQVTET